MTAIQGIEREAKCPVCESDMDLARLAKLGLSYEELAILNEHIRNGTIKDILNAGDIALRRIDPEAANIELQVTSAISELRNAFNQLQNGFTGEMRLSIDDGLKLNDGRTKQLIDKLQDRLKQIDTQIQRLEATRNDNQTMQNTLHEILRRIGGTGIGSIGETITIRDLKQVVPSDDFDETRATQGGTDIIGKVNENGIFPGTITISVKYAEKWENSHMEQITKNMKQDDSRFGILVSKAFPKQAISDKAWLMKTREGNSVILVKPEYAPLAYYGLRQATLVWYQMTQMQKTREKETDEMEKIFKALMYWINGEEFQKSISYIDFAIGEANKTKTTMNALKKYVDGKIEEVIGCQDRITGNLTTATGLLGKLKELLNGDSNPSFSRNVGGSLS
jgi:hypothetical protein